MRRPVKVNNDSEPGQQPEFPDEIDVVKTRKTVPDALALMHAVATIQEKTKDDTFEVDVVVKALHLTEDQDVAGKEVHTPLLYLETLNRDVRSIWVYEIASGALMAVKSEVRSAETKVVDPQAVSVAVHKAYENQQAS
jgi:hypothetical protein